jgi:ATPase subunit of ABC transporter with duplicated ATPase domains
VDLTVTAKSRTLSARGLDVVAIELADMAAKMGTSDESGQAAALAKYSTLEERFISLGGWSAEAEALSLLSSLGLPDRLFDEPLSSLSGGQRRRVELARVLFSGSSTVVLDEPTNHLDADSIAWLRSFLRSYNGGLLIISHDASLLEATVNRVFHLDADTAELEIYNLAWRTLSARSWRCGPRRTRCGPPRRKRLPHASSIDAPSGSRRARRRNAVVSASLGSCSRRPPRVDARRSRREASRSGTGRSRCSRASTSTSTAARASSCSA